MDALTEALGTVRLSGAVLTTAEMSAPWCVAFPATSRAFFHIVVRGTPCVSRSAAGWKPSARAIPRRVHARSAAPPVQRSGPRRSPDLRPRPPGTARRAVPAEGRRRRRLVDRRLRHVHVRQRRRPPAVLVAPADDGPPRGPPRRHTWLDHLVGLDHPRGAEPGGRRRSGTRLPRGRAVRPGRPLDAARAPRRRFVAARARGRADCARPGLHPPGARASLDRRRPRERRRHVALGVRGAVHRARRRVTAAVPHPVADAARDGAPALGRGRGVRRRGSGRLHVRRDVLPGRSRRGSGSHRRRTGALEPHDRQPGAGATIRPRSRPRPRRRPARAASPRIPAIPRGVTPARAIKGEALGSGFGRATSSPHTWSSKASARWKCASTASTFRRADVVARAVRCTPRAARSRPISGRFGSTRLNASR